ncbi:MAG: LysM peptidoglycan-binding domain-containing protein, partial [Candidatus Woesearchaeota archaeon]|nr:LysM peptidoglycan-binding domain-containing protein [Candidatus Woesearchaeota archaeon]
HYNILHIDFKDPFSKSTVAYKIKEGDTFYSLARKKGTNVGHLKKLNPHVIDINKIPAGEVIYLPAR